MKISHRKKCINNKNLYICFIFRLFNEIRSVTSSVDWCNVVLPRCMTICRTSEVCLPAWLLFFPPIWKRNKKILGLLFFCTNISFSFIPIQYIVTLCQFNSTSNPTMFVICVLTDIWYRIVFQGEKHNSLLAE